MGGWVGGWVGAFAYLDDGVSGVDLHGLLRGHVRRGGGVTEGLEGEVDGWVCGISFFLW